LKFSAWFWGLFLCLTGLVFLRHNLVQSHFIALPAAASPTAAPVEAVNLAGYFPLGPPLPVVVPVPDPEPPQRVVVDTLGPDDSIYHALKRNGIADQQIFRLHTALKKVFNPQRASRPDDHFRLIADTSGVIQRFEYVPQAASDHLLVVETLEDRLEGRRVELPVEIRLRTIEVRIDDNLSNALAAAGEDDRLTDQLADQIFGGTVNFRRDPQQGDRIALLFEKRYRNDRFLGYGNILLAHYDGKKVKREAVFYRDPNGRADYYDRQGASLERPFRLLPLSFRRISSRFNTRRFHPILKKTVPHLGTDYAAPTGTRVWATAGGRITHAGTKGGYGKMVEITHANGYRSRYAHLSRISVRSGQQVRQKQVVGRVGATGRATGPHLHYELIKNGRHINPERANKKAQGKALDPDYAEAFAAHRHTLNQRLVAMLGSQQNLFVADAER
jgi:murein DD-endopeptidase MepM/ murein hydrolase activator NlpD